MLDTVFIMLITVSPAEKILEISEGTVRALVRRGELTATRTSTGVRLFEREEVERLAQKRADRQHHIPPSEAA